MKLFFLLIVLFVNTCFSQTVLIKITSNEKAVPFATISDSMKGVIQFSDMSGEAGLKSDNYNLTISHVSFDDYHLSLPGTAHDTIVLISLTPKATVLETVSVYNEKADKSKKYKYEVFEKKLRSSLTLREKILLGVNIPLKNFDSDDHKYLRSICFILDSIQKTRKEEFVIEFKVYALNENNQPEPVPLNIKPLYLRSGDVKKNNEIILNEKILLPEYGLFISAELPEVFTNKYLYTITFSGDYKTDKPQTFIKKNYDGKWHSEDFKNGLQLPDGKYWAMNFGITYWKSKKR